jgi:hypothetical protein
LTNPYQLLTDVSVDKVWAEELEALDKLLPDEFWQYGIVGSPLLGKPPLPKNAFEQWVYNQLKIHDEVKREIKGYQCTFRYVNGYLTSVQVNVPVQMGRSINIVYSQREAGWVRISSTVKAFVSRYLAEC